MRLKYLFIGAFIFLAAFPLFAGLLYINYHFGQQYIAQVDLQMESLSSIAKKRLITAIERIEDNTVLISSRTQLRISLNQWNKSGNNSDAQKMSRIIKDAQKSLKDLQSIRIYDLQGELVVSTGPPAGLSSIDLKIKGIDIALIQMKDELYMISSSALILDGVNVGFMQLDFHESVITDLIEDRTGLGETGEWLFAMKNQKGDALFAVPLKYDEEAAFNRTTSKDIINSPITQALKGNEIVMRDVPDYRGESVLASTRYISEQSWGLVVKIDMNEINQQITQNTILIYVVEFIVITLSILMGLLLSIYISRPLKKLKDGTSIVAKGDFTPTYFYSELEEVKDLNDHFTHMVKSLEELNIKLKKKVDEKTHKLQEAKDRLEKLAVLDHLTDLYNRRHFESRFTEEFSAAKRHSRELTLVILDVDNFKLVNDTYGHPIGDDVLKKIANTLKESIRKSDILARIGGEEFCLLLPSSSRNGAMVYLERVRKSISKIECRSGNEKFNITCSFGAAVLDVTITDKEVLMSRADKALYQAKDEGRNRIIFYKDPDNISVMTKDH